MRTPTSLSQPTTLPQAADEVKQLLTYKREYFNSPWNYIDVASCVMVSCIFVLHLTRLNHQVRLAVLAWTGRSG